ncbi:MAG: hypothetical protein ACI8P9_001611 [Parasphingorhabdus sp.]|jgi:hypothetical protein
MLNIRNLYLNMSVLFNDRSGTWHNEITSITFAQGHLFINDILVESHWAGNDVFWIRTDNTSSKEYGRITVTSNGRTAHGVTETQGDTQSFVANNLVDYSTTIDNGREYWFDFEMGFMLDKRSNSHAIGKLNDTSDTTTTEQLEHYAHILFGRHKHKDAANSLSVLVEIDPVFCAVGGGNWIAAEFDFSPTYRSFTGNIYQYDETHGRNRGTAHTLTGILKNADRVNQRIQEGEMAAISTYSENSCSTNQAVLADSMLRAMALPMEAQGLATALLVCPHLTRQIFLPLTLPG